MSDVHWDEPTDCQPWRSWSGWPGWSGRPNVQLVRANQVQPHGSLATYRGLQGVEGAGPELEKSGHPSSKTRDSTWSTGVRARMGQWRQRHLLEDDKVIADTTLREGPTISHSDMDPYYRGTGLAPTLEPQILMDVSHSTKRCYKVTDQVHQCFIHQRKVQYACFKFTFYKFWGFGNQVCSWGF